MASNGIHIETDEAEPAPIPMAEAYLADFGDPDALPVEDVEAEEHVAYEARDFGTADEAQPDTQGDEPLEAELGDDGQGDLAPEDL